MPISRIIRLALIVVKVVILCFGPKWPRRMAMMSGPPARPSLMGCGMPGKRMGREPKMIPTTMPRKMGTRFGLSRAPLELPTCSATRLMFCSAPMQIRASPICRYRSGRATSSTPERMTRVTLTS